MISIWLRWIKRDRDTKMIHHVIFHLFQGIVPFFSSHHINPIIKCWLHLFDHNLFSCIFPQGSITLIKAGKYNSTIIKLLLLYHSCFCLTIVEPVLSSTVLSGNPLSSGLFSESYSDVETNEKQHWTDTTESRPQNGQQNTNACKSNHCPIPHNQKQGEKSFHAYIRQRQQKHWT